MFIILLCMHCDILYILFSLNLFVEVKALQGLCLRNRSAPAVNCWVIIHCLEVSCKEDQITSAQREWFIFVQLTDKRWIITQQFTHWSWSISILTRNKRRKHIRSLQLLPTFRHCTEELPPILRLRRIRLHVIARPSSSVRQDGERRTTFLAEYAFRRVPFFSFRLILLFTLILFNLSKFIDAIVNNTRCACHQ